MSGKRPQFIVTNTYVLQKTPCSFLMEVAGQPDFMVGDDHAQRMGELEKKTLQAPRLL